MGGQRRTAVAHPWLGRARDAYAGGERGDFGAADQVQVELDDVGGAEARAFRLALAAQRWHADPDGGRLPSRHELVDLREASTVAREAGVLASGEAARAAFVAFDPATHATWIELQASLATGVSLPEEVAVEARSGRAFAAVLTGDPSGVELAAEVEREANHCLAERLAAEMAALQALILLDAADLGGALAHMRRALAHPAHPRAQYLACHALARLRRLEARPTAAVQLLKSLARTVPPSWWGWTGWELALAGGLEAVQRAPLERAPGHLAVATMALRELLDQAARGHHEAFAQAAETVCALVADVPGLDADMEALLLQTDPDASLESARADVVAWCEGWRDLPARGLVALGAIGEGSQVLVVPGRSPRRVLGFGAAFLEADPLRSAGDERLDAAIAALAAAGEEGLAPAELFRACYGLDYEPDVHRATLDALVHRAGDHLDLEEAADVVRGSDRIELRFRRPFRVQDRRCGPPLEDRLADILGERGPMTDRDLAHTTGDPPPLVQQGLRRLVDEGICDVDRSGGKAQYMVDEIHLLEPVRH